MDTWTFFLISLGIIPRQPRIDVWEYAFAALQIDNPWSVLLLERHIGYYVCSLSESELKIWKDWEDKIEALSKSWSAQTREYVGLFLEDLASIYEYEEYYKRCRLFQLPRALRELARDLRRSHQ